VNVKYAVAVLSVFTAVVVARVLEIRLVSAPASLFLCAVMFGAWFGGIGPGVVSFVLAHLAFIYYFVTPTHTLVVEMEEVPRILIFSVSAAFVIALSVAQRSATEALQRTNETLETLAGRLIDAQEEERSRIGRELHDHISQTLGVLTIKIDQLRARGEITPGVGASLDELRRDTSAITDDVHRLSHRLHSSTLDYLGLAPALQKLVAEFSERHGIAITFAQTSLPAALPSEVKLCLFRIAEEALTNIAKHSHARSASVLVIGDPDGLHLRVEDAGTGFDTTRLQSKAGLGFISMRERLRVLHGMIHVYSAPSRGTRIEVWVPAATVRSALP
jgi:signal transduction histidine kinase